MGSTLQLRLPATLTAAQVRRLCAGLAEQLAVGTVSVVVCRVDPAATDLATVDAVARLALVARRAGVVFVLEPPARHLSSLLELVGLRGALAGLREDR
jgi:hypothetical protein